MTATCLENKSAVNCRGSIPPACVEILRVVSKAVMHPAFNRYQIGSTPIPPTFNLSALISVYLRLKIKKIGKCGCVDSNWFGIPAYGESCRGSTPPLSFLIISHQSLVINNRLRTKNS